VTDYRAWVERIATEIDPGATPQAVLDSIARLQPAPDAVVPAVRQLVQEARDWTRDSDVVTLPAGTLPVVREAPWRGAGSWATLVAPGPVEDATATFLDLAGERLAPPGLPALVAVVLHETYPGRYVQRLHERRIERDIRRVFLPRSLSDGWANYAEHVALDEGFRGQDPVVRLAQLQRALVLHARWHAVLQLHALNQPIEAVVRQVMDIAYLDEAAARREVLRASHEPNALAPALGRMQILELRTSYQSYLEEREEEFDMKAFHDRLLELGLPLTLATEAFMPPPPPLAPRRPTR
jgi:hypothetical protein